MIIRKYTKDDANALMNIIEAEEGWDFFIRPDNAEKYQELLANSITYVAYSKDTLCGYVRAIKDGDFFIFVSELLVSKKCRGKSIGKKLMESICEDYTQTVYVMSDIDQYYEKQGYKREGSVFKIR